MVGLVGAGAAVMVQFLNPLHYTQRAQGQVTDVSVKRVRESLLLVLKAVKGLVEFGLCSKTGVGEEQCIILHWAGSFYSDLCYLPRVWTRREIPQEERELDPFPDSNC